MRLLNGIGSVPGLFHFIGNIFARLAVKRISRTQEVDMNVSPVSRYANPRYPAREILDEHPELLRLPRRWRQHALVLAALTAVGTLAAGCRPQAAVAEIPTGGAPPPPPAPAFAKVAPIFEYGTGHGAFGGIGGNSPVFLSEDDARQVIVDESKRAGITFAADGKRFTEFNMPVTWVKYGGDKEHAPALQRRELVLDGMDAAKGIGYEYVSKDDFTAWQSKDNPMHSTAWSEDLLAPARQLRDELVKVESPGAYGVFYDPMVGMNRSQPEYKPAPFSEQTLMPANLCDWYLTARADIGKDGVTLVGKTKTIVLKDGSAEATVDGRTVALPCKVRMRNGMPYVPLQWTVEQFGGSTHWDARSHEVAIIRPDGRGKPEGPVQEIVFPGSDKPLSVAFAYADSMTINAVTKEAAREDLRQQVRDFITWLKAEGVI